MPMYQYECKGCAKTFEEKATFAEHDRHREVTCPHCGGTDVAQVLTPTGVMTAKKS
jgi:putative FmdB family regulatory protein